MKVEAVFCFCGGGGCQDPKCPAIVHLSIHRFRVLGFRCVDLPGSSSMRVPKGPWTHIVYTLALNESLYRYIGAKVYSSWAHGPLR